jgi:glycoside/pentoside/hexuronide:cation symporter, GPH family
MSGQVDQTPLARTASARYGLLGLPLAFVALPVYVHLPNLYAQHHGVPLAALGGVLLFSRAADALIDPWLGRVGDALYRRSWTAAWWAAALLALGIAAGFVALFFPPALSPDALLLWVVAALTLSHVSYSGLTILHQAWAARQGGGVHAQSRWVAWREGWGLVGVLLASALPTLLGWTATTVVLVLALLAGLWAWQQAQSLKSADAPASNARVAAASFNEASAFWRPWRTPGFARLLGVFVVNGLASALPATLVLFFVQDGVQAPQAMQPLFLGVYFAAGALSFPLWLRLIDRFGLLRSWWVVGAGLCRCAGTRPGRRPCVFGHLSRFWSGLGR